MFSIEDAGRRARARWRSTVGFAVAVAVAVEVVVAVAVAVAHRIRRNAQCMSVDRSHKCRDDGSYYLDDREI